MLKCTFVVIPFILSLSLYAQHNSSNVTVYLFHGQGSNHMLFSKMELPEGFDTVHIHYPRPSRRESLTEYAYRIIPQIETSKPFVLLGVSLGGMISSILADSLHPNKTILISSAACTKEIPFRYKLMRVLPINRLVPKWFYKWGAFIAQPLVEPDRKKEKVLFNKILKQNNPHFLKQSTRMIVHWGKTCHKEGLIHIHGTKDHTLPLKKVQANYIIEGGSHMMVLTRSGEINALLKRLLAVEN